jgi:F-type H+-transporting ATPase subunit gamma
MRLKSIKNIGKITKSMKMIASTKLNRAQKTMEIGRNYSAASKGTSSVITLL